MLQVISASLQKNHPMAYLELYKYENALNFATDTWISPNHKAYIAFTVHFVHEGDPMSMLLDLIEVAESHSGINLVNAFAKVFEDFGITDKVRQFFIKLNNH
jgi:hypothetical protein